MLIERSVVESRTFNLDAAGDLEEYNELLDDPAVRVLHKKFIDHTEVEQEGRMRTEVKEMHIYVEWERCTL